MGLADRAQLVRARPDDRADRRSQRLAVDPPLLIVEILSKWNRLDDLVTKRDKYAAGGLPWYWIVDLDAASLTVLELSDGVYLRRQVITEPGTTVGPIEVTIDPTSPA